MKRMSRWLHLAEKFDRSHPDVWTLFVKYAFELINAGNAHGAARMIFHHIRWFHKVDRAGKQDFKINNNFSPYFSRKFAAMFPKHRDFFFTRETQQERAEAA